MRHGYILTQAVQRAPKQRTDKRFIITFDTPQITNAGSIDIFKNATNLTGVLTFETKAKAPLPTIHTEDGAKTPSKALYEALFIYYTAHVGEADTFEPWYRQWMEKKINEIYSHV